jgi:hypothetical protein
MKPLRDRPIGAKLGIVVILSVLIALSVALLTILSSRFARNCAVLTRMP